jgi:hypothetical protein
MRKPSDTHILLGTILIFSLLIHGVCIVAADTGTNASITDEANYTQPFSWVLLLPIFFGRLLFLGWFGRYFEEMSLYFVLFTLSLPAVILILATIFFVDFSKNIFFDGLLFLALIVLISPIVSVIMNTRGKDIKTRNEIVIKLLDKTRSINIIGVMLIWPVVLIYFYVKNIKYIAFNGIENLTFPVYIITASFIGVLSYLLLSIEDTFCHLIPEYQKKSIAWSYLRRMLIAPFIAIIGYYLLYFIQNRPEGLKDINDRFVFIFSFFAGIFTKSIEEWIYAWVQKLLPGDKLKEFQSRDQYDVDNSDLGLVTKQLR